MKPMKPKKIMNRLQIKPISPHAPNVINVPLTHPLGGTVKVSTNKGIYKYMIRHHAADGTLLKTRGVENIDHAHHVLEKEMKIDLSSLKKKKQN